MPDGMMVSVNLSPTQGIYSFDPMNAGGNAAEEVNKKVRKPYTITKSRENWTELEHDLFIEALHLFYRDWKKIESFVGSKTIIQDNLHFPAPSSFIEPGCMISSDVPGNSLATRPMSAWRSRLSKDDDQISNPVIPNYCCSSISIDSTPISWPNSWAIDDRNIKRPLRATPDFAEVYRFIGSTFDPDTDAHLERLKEMDPINLETALLLMRNSRANLMSPEFEKHRKILGVFGEVLEKENSGKPYLKFPSVILSA